MGFEPASDIPEPFTVPDLTTVWAGPTCVRQLADRGANVIMIEALALGQHTDEILPGIGYDGAAISRFRKDDII